MFVIVNLLFPFSTTFFFGVDLCKVIFGWICWRLRFHDLNFRSSIGKAVSYLNTGKLELPSISQVHTRGPVDIPWYNRHAAERHWPSSDRLPSLTLPPSNQLPLSGFQLGDQDSSTVVSSSPNNPTVQSSIARYIGDVKTSPRPADGARGGQGRLSLDTSAHLDPPIPSNPVNEGPYMNLSSAHSMNQAQPFLDMHPSHLSSAQPYASQGVTSGALVAYSHYQQPPVLQPGSTYPSAAGSYSQYGYPNGVAQSPQSGTQPPSSQVPAQLLPLPAMTTPTVTHGYVTNSNPPSQPYTFDTTGQIAPPGAKPRVTATLWEDEGSLCYQVEAKGVCVARREDNHMINGTKLLNVAGMTRGRRDGILKSEKIRHVVKIGPMHLKGVWIPFDRALDFANKEKITDLLYPLFVHNIGGLLYHPTNQSRTNMVVHESQQRRLEGVQPTRTSQGPQPPPTLHHHHSMQTPVTSHMPQPPAPSIAQPSTRPTLDRAHSFPTPPTNSSSLMAMTTQGNSYEWAGQSMGSGVQGSQSLSLDSGLSTARSLPTTPGTSPPGGSIQGMHTYQSQSGYDASKSYYSTAPHSQTQYAQQPLAQPSMASYGQSIPPTYVKNEMAPPSGRPSSQSDAEHGDVKSERYSQGNNHVSHAEGEAVQEHDDYLHDNGAAYTANRGPYTYTTNPSVGPLTGEPSHLPSELTGSPSHQNGSDRMTPRGGGTQQSWASGYTPPRSGASSGVYNIVTETRGTANGNTDSFSAPSNNTTSYTTTMNGSLGSGKRLRDDDDDRIPRPDSRGGDYDTKRRKTLTESTVGGPVGGVGGPPLGLQPVKAGGMSRRR